MNSYYEVLNPWAEVDPMSVRGISPRITDLDKKKIGLFCSNKRASKLILTVVEKKIKGRFPTSEFSWYEASEPYRVLQMASKDKARFEEWAKGVDTIIASTGD
jgi:hypothetical protein